MSRTKKVLISLVILGAIGGAAAWFGAREKTEARFEPVKVKREDLRQTVLATGGVGPQNRLEVKPPVNGRVENILVKEGQIVRKGQVIAWLSSTERAAVLDAARARGPEELKRWQEIYRATPLIAPLSGLVINRRVEPGQSVNTGDAIVVMSDRLILRAVVDETDIGLIKVGQKTSIVLDAYPDHTVSGTVDHVAFEASTVNNVTTYTVEVVPDVVPDFMKSGMTANVRFEIALRANALSLPTSAIRQGDGDSFVLVRGPEGQPPRAKPVQTGITDGKFVEIVSGIGEGEEVLVRVHEFNSDDGDKPANPFAPQLGRGNRKRERERRQRGAGH